MTDDPFRPPLLKSADDVWKDAEKLDRPAVDIIKY
jgi:hypothetical protein